MMLLDTHNETHDKYIQAIRALNDANKTSDYHKVPATPEEQAFKQEVDNAASRRSTAINYINGQYERIFKE